MNKVRTIFLSLLLVLSFSVAATTFAQDANSGSTTLAPQKTETKNFDPNGYGCSTSDTKGYCLLAPLNDAQGSKPVDVTMGIGEYIKTAIRLFMGLISVLAVLMVIVGGIEYMMTVNIGEKEGAKSRILNALGGLVLALASYLILNTINPKLVDLKVAVPQATVGLSLDPTFSKTPYDSKPTAGSGHTENGGTTPTVTKNLDKYNDIIRAAAKANGVDCTYAKAIMSVEDQSGNPKAFSNYTQSDGTTGHAYGLMELTPETYAANGGTGSITDPTNNINAGVTYIGKLQNGAACSGGAGDCTTRDRRYISAAYNGGPGANAPSKDCGSGVTKWECPINRGGYQQTYDYANQVETNYNKMVADGTEC